MASAARPSSVPSVGSLTTRSFLRDVVRYSGSFAASETAWLPATQPTAPMSENPRTTTMSVDTTRPSFSRSNIRTAGASRKASRMASASGISTSRARYRIAAAASRATIDRVLIGEMRLGQLEEEQ